MLINHNVAVQAIFINTAHLGKKYKMTQFKNTIKSHITNNNNNTVLSEILCPFYEKVKIKEKGINLQRKP